MRNFLKRSMALFVMAIVMLSSVTAFADGERKLYDVYNFDEKFEYEDEIIASALKSTVVKIENTVAFRAEYNPVVFESSVFVTDYMTLVQNNPGATVDDIIAYMKENIVDYLYYQNETKVIEDGLTWVGSGVVISEDGYIATNTHVIEVDEDEAMNHVGQYVAESVVDDFVEIITSAEEWGIEFTEEDIDVLGDVIIEATAENLDVSLGNSSLCVLMPTASGETDYEKAQRYDAQIVRKGTSTASNESTAGVTQDGAIIKIDGFNLVSLELSDEYPKEASSLMAAGFPVAADVIFTSIGSEKSVLAVSVTSGNVDRLAQFDKYKAIGITNRISGGNSGGPSVDNTLKIEGLNTYTYTEDARFAYMIPAEFLRDQSLGINIVRDEVTKTFLLGLQMLQQDYGVTATECFMRVQQLQPNTPYIESLIKEANMAPQEKAPKAAISFSISPVVWIILGIVLAVVILVIIIVLIVSAAGKKKRRNMYYQSETSNSFSSFDSGSSDGSLF